jgi:hypothetical protein
MTTAARSFESDDQRLFSERTAVHSPSTLRDERQVPITVQVVDLSPGGCRIRSDAALDVGARIDIGLPGYGSVAARLMWRRDHDYGCEFLGPLPAGALQQAFSGDVIVAFPASVGRVTELDAPEEIQRWPRSVRLGVLLGGSGLLWAAIILLGSRLFG